MRSHALHEPVMRCDDGDDGNGDVDAGDVARTLHECTASSSARSREFLATAGECITLTFT